MDIRLIAALDRRPTFAQLKGEPVLSVSARVEQGAVRQRAHIMHEHFVAGGRQVFAGALSFNQLEERAQRREMLYRHSIIHVQ